MEILYAYALLLCVGYDVWAPYSAELDRMFLEDPENEIYLSLELTTDVKQVALQILSLMSREAFDTGLFGRTLMKLISEIYKKSDLKDFAVRMYALWNHLPDFIYEQEPFFTLCYADDCLSYGDEAQCRKLYEDAMSFYS